jgi:hypothetical protein
VIFNRWIGTMITCLVHVTIDGWKSNYTSFRRTTKLLLIFDFLFFDLICRHLLPEEVLSLTVSDNNDTPDQTKLFFSRFPIEQFTQLRSLALINIEFQTSLNILSNLHQLERLRCLSSSDGSIRCRDSNRVGRAYRSLIEVYNKVIPQLNSLYVNNGAVLMSISSSF